jgi:hypothetical protein
MLHQGLRARSSSLSAFVALECDEGRESGSRGPGEGGRRLTSNSLSQARADIGRAAGPFE